MLIEEATIPAGELTMASQKYACLHQRVFSLLMNRIEMACVAKRSLTRPNQAGRSPPRAIA